MKSNCVLAVLTVVVIASFAASTARAEDAYNLAWVRQIGTANYDESRAVAVDELGNVYISGWTDGILSGPNNGSWWDTFLAKYDSSGSLLWTRQIGTTNWDECNSLALDALGNAYITGRTRGSMDGPNAGQQDAFLVKCDSSGSPLWKRQIGTTDYDESYSVAVDTSGNAYISGYTQGSLSGPNAGSSDAFLAKYDSTGSLLWTRQVGTTSGDYGRSVAVDGSGNVYMSGYTGGSLGGPSEGQTDAFLFKYDLSGSLLWTRQLGTTVGDGSCSVAVDGSGNVYISGFTEGSLGGPKAGGIYNDDAFLAKYDSSGNLLWTSQIGGTGWDVSYSVAVDTAGNAYISGYTDGILGEPNPDEGGAFLAKYDTLGNLLWTAQIGTTALDQSNAVAVDGLGNAYISGYTYGSLGGPNPNPSYPDAFLAKFSAPTAVVPEPGTVFMIASAVVGFAGIAFKKMRKG